MIAPSVWCGRITTGGSTYHEVARVGMVFDWMAGVGVHPILQLEFHNTLQAFTKGVKYHVTSDYCIPCAMGWQSGWAR